MAPTHAAAHRNVLRELLAHATRGLDLTALAQEPPPATLVAPIDHALLARANELHSRGESAGLTPDVLVAEARRELFDLGPLGPLLDDPDVEEVHVLRHDLVLAVHDQKHIATEIAFSSEEALERALRRLCARNGVPVASGEQLVERRLRGGVRLTAAIAPGVVDAHVAVLRKTHRSKCTLDELVRAGALSRGMAMVLSAALQGRANMLVVGSNASGAYDVLSALVAASAVHERVLVLDADTAWTSPMPHSVSVAVDDAPRSLREALRLAAHVRPERLVLPALSRSLLGGILELIAGGAGGVMAGLPSPSIRQAILRLPADLAATQPALTVETAREWLASAFDIVVEVARLDDGRLRVVRIAELSASPGALGVSDVFTFAPADPRSGPEGHFHPTGVVPRVVEDLVDRGIALDRSIFQRSGR